MDYADSNEAEIMLFIHELSEPHENENRNTITFQGVKFNSEVPVHTEAFCLNLPRSMKRLVGFLRSVDMQNRTKGLIRGGWII